MSDLYTGPRDARHRYVVADADGIQGGQGVVFRAKRVINDEPVDVSLKQLADNTAERQRVILERGARLEAIEHPNIAEHLESFLGPGLFHDPEPDEQDCNLAYAAARWIDGTPLSASSPLEPAHALRIIVQLADAVAYLHAHDLTHRDLHPGNVIITPEGHAVVIDLAHTRPIQPDATTLVHGARGFVPPERFVDATVADEACDRWQLGMLATYAISGAPQGRQSTAELEASITERVAGTVAAPMQTARRITRMLNADPTARPTDVAAWAASLLDTADTAVSASGQSRRGRLLVGVGAAIIALAVLGTYTLLRSGNSPARSTAEDRPTASSALTPATTTQATPTTLPCATTVAAPDATFAAQAAMLTTEVGRSGGCAASNPIHNGPLLIQELRSESGPPPALIATGPGTLVTMTAAQWGSYHQIGGSDGSRYYETVGAPTRIIADANSSIVYFERGRMAGARPDLPHFWMIESLTALWDQSGGVGGKLGLPTSNPYTTAGTIRQEYQRGIMVLPPGGAEVKVEEVSDPASALPTEIKGHILRQADGTAWYVDDQGTRHWIPDGTTWNCVGGDAIVAANARALPGYAVSTLPVGTAARCNL